MSCNELLGYRLKEVSEIDPVSLVKVCIGAPVLARTRVALYLGSWLQCGAVKEEGKTKFSFRRREEQGSRVLSEAPGEHKARIPSMTSRRTRPGMWHMANGAAFAGTAPVALLLEPREATS